jgi:hypothetical protein
MSMTTPPMVTCLVPVDIVVEVEEEGGSIGAGARRMDRLGGRGNPNDGESNKEVIGESGGVLSGEIDEFEVSDMKV